MIGRIDDIVHIYYNIYETTSKNKNRYGTGIYSR